MESWGGRMYLYPPLSAAPSTIVTMTGGDVLLDYFHGKSLSRGSIGGGMVEAVVVIIIIIITPSGGGG
jgi:hypothetical protein